VGLNPFIDQLGILRVGGRIEKSELEFIEKKPVILLKGHHISNLIVQHYHERTQHQGRHLTEGAVRAAGWWIVGLKRLVSSIIHHCVSCRRTRGKLQHQMMAELPSDRLEVAPPFTNVGVDIFGPWEVLTRKTRGGQANSKRWAVLFTCLVTRSVHIELVEEMTSSAFINAMRRFMAIRGPVKIFRSDRGTNFVGAVNELKEDSVNVEEGNIKHFLFNSNCTWIFNSPHSPHMGGAWERLIGIAKGILNNMLYNKCGKYITHDILSTFMSEVCAIMNSRPLSMTSDPDCSFVLTPSVLLTQKTNVMDCSNLSTYDIDCKDVYKSQWKRVQAMANTFWSCWKKEYLHKLQARHKWFNKTDNIKVGDVVIVKEDDHDCYQWTTGIVTKTVPSSDDIVRKVEIQTLTNGKPANYTRPIVDLVVLFNEEL
jgi:hypothetical protein